MFSLTREQKIEALTMRIDGYTYDEIGARLGMSKQNVHKLMQSYFLKPDKQVKKIIYPTIKDWVRSNGTNIRELAEKAGISYQHLIFVLYGEREPGLKVIKRILDVTGLTYEEAFRVDDNN